MKIGLKRLLKLADILDVADAEHRKRGEPAYAQAIVTHACGSPACAIGHWAASNKRRWGVSLFGTSVKLLKGPYAHDMFSSIEHEFDLSELEAEEIFESYGCGGAKTAKQAAKYIRKFVARKQKELER